MKRHWRTIAVVAAVVVIALSVVAVAYGATRTARRAAGTTACGALMGNPKAAKAMQDVRAQHRQELQAWRDQYRADPSSAEAQAALEALREEHWNDMRDVFKKLGIKVPAGVGPGGMMGGSGGCGAACGGARSGAGAQGTGYGNGMMGSGGGMMGGWDY